MNYAKLGSEEDDGSPISLDVLKEVVDERKGAEYTEEVDSFIVKSEQRKLKVETFTIDIDEEDDCEKLPSEKQPNKNEDNEIAEDLSKMNTNELLKKILIMAYPVVIGFFLNLGGSFTTLGFAGHLPASGDMTSSTYLAAISLANMFSNVTCLSLLIGMTTAMETLGSQYFGHGSYEKVGMTLNRSIVLLLLLSIPTYITWHFAENIFLLLGIDATVCKLIGLYLRIRMFGIPCDCLEKSYAKYLSSIGVMRPCMYGSLTFVISLVILNTICIVGLKLGVASLGICYVTAQHLAATVEFVASLDHPNVQKTIPSMFKFKEIMQYNEMVQYIKLGIPGTLMLCAEWWAYELLTVLASRLGTSSVAAQTIIMSCASLAYMIPLGLSVAVSSMVGNAVGAGNKTLAFDISKLSLKIIVCLELFMGVVLYFGGTYFAGLFTNESSVLSICQLSMSFMAFFVLVDGVFGVISGILRGAGKQAVGAVTNICSFYIVGLPVAAIFCFKTDFGVPGLLMGMSIAACLQDVIVTTYIFRDPEKVFERVAEESADEVNSPLTKEAEMVKIDSFEEDEKDCDEEEITL